jgi:hypothetical protein
MIASVMNMLSIVCNAGYCNVTSLCAGSWSRGCNVLHIRGGDLWCRICAACVGQIILQSQLLLAVLGTLFAQASSSAANRSCACRCILANVMVAGSCNASDGPAVELQCNCEMQSKLCSS